MADAKVKVTVSEVAEFPTPSQAGRKRNFLPESTAAAKTVLTGKVVQVSDEGASKVVSQVRTLVEEAGKKLRTRASADGSMFLALKEAAK